MMTASFTALAARNWTNMQAGSNLELFVGGARDEPNVT